MSTKSNSNELPTAEEMFAYTNGELSPEDEARVRKALVQDPELVRTLTAPIPADDAEPRLSQEKLDAQWAAMQQRIGARGRVLQFRHVWTALAATLALLFGGLLWQSQLNVRRLEHELAQPRVAAAEQLLLPDGQRGPGESSALLTTEGESVLLVVPVIGAAQFDAYRLQLVDVATKQALWTSNDLRRRDNDTFAILVPRAFFKPGRVQVVLTGAGRSEPLATYTLRVP